MVASHIEIHLRQINFSE